MTRYERSRMAKKISEERQYGALEDILTMAANQAQHGKGKERHANEGEPFEDQKICEITRRLSDNPVAGPLFQAVKKCYESGRLPKDKAIVELRGAIVYIAAAIRVREEQNG